MPLELPGQFQVAQHLIRALHGNQSERDRRLARLALACLEPDHREFYLSRPNAAAEVDEWWSAHRGDKRHQTLITTSPRALRVVFWKLGLVTDPGHSYKRRPRQCRMISSLMDKHLGADPAQTAFACLTCGSPIHLPVGKKGQFVCPTCGHGSRLSYNDGCRIAFSRPKRVPEPVMKPKLLSLQQACEALQVSPCVTFQEMRTVYRSKLKQNHPDTIRCLGNPLALWASEEVTRTLTAAWEVIEHYHQQIEVRARTPTDAAGTVGGGLCPPGPTGMSTSSR